MTVTELNPTPACVQIEGPGLISGLPYQVTLAWAKAGQPTTFILPDGSQIQAHLASVTNTQRGVTLACPTSDQKTGQKTGQKQAQTLSIVEHFLAACSLLNAPPLQVKVEGPGPHYELPLLDGSAQPWIEALEQLLAGTISSAPAGYQLKNNQAVFVRTSETTCLYALPAKAFELTYTLDYQPSFLPATTLPHTEVTQQFVHWHASEGYQALACAGTFGRVEELPLVQAQGLAQGVTPDNTLGLTVSPTGQAGYTRPLRLPEEPIRHKMLDLIGDLTLMGLNPLGINAHIYAVNAGHTGHIALARALKPHLHSV